MNDMLIQWWDSDACDVNQWDVYHSSADTDIQWSKYHSISPIICDPLCENPVKKSFFVICFFLQKIIFIWQRTCENVTVISLILTE